MVLKAFGTLRGLSAGLHEFGPDVKEFFGSDSYIPILRESRQARNLVSYPGQPDKDGTGIR